MLLRKCLVIGTVLILAACGSSAGPATSPTPPAITTGSGLATAVTVSIPVSSGDYDVTKPSPSNFTPGGLEVAAGGTVTWRNNDVVSHVTANSANLWNAPLAPGGTFSRVFPTVGSFDYKCTIHPDMTGTITVK